MKEEETQIKYEQQDLVMILLNLAYIPDSVIRQDYSEFNFEPGWQFYFLKSMEKYK